MKKPKLTPVDMKKPRLSESAQYLVCNILGTWVTGRFKKDGRIWRFSSDLGSVYYGIDGWKAIYKIS